MSTVRRDEALVSAEWERYTLQSMPDPTVLYSASTFLAYRIAQQYYKDVHYVWCSPVFDGRTSGPLDPTVPPTSSPCEIYWSLHQEVSRGDRHSAKITENRAGIIRGAQFKRKIGVINEEIESDIIAATELAETRDFRPLMLIIPYAKVKRLIEKVPIKSRAHPLSVECLISSLPGKLFSVIEFGGPL